MGRSAGLGKHKFSAIERYAVLATHGDKCYLCNAPLTLVTMEVDHVLPESLDTDPDEFVRVRTALGRPEDFDLNSHENWLPSCRPCNRRKASTVFEASGIVQVYLQQAAAKAGDARAVQTASLTDARISKAVGVLLIAQEGGTLTQQQLQALAPLREAVVASRPTVDRARPVMLSAQLELLSDNGMIRIYKGPFGIGGSPSAERLGPSFFCPDCGATAWNGARCVNCGQLSDD